MTPIKPQKKPWVTPSVRIIPLTDQILRKILVEQDSSAAPSKKLASG